MSGTVGIIGSSDRTLEATLREAGVQTVILPPDYPGSSHSPRQPLPDALLVDVRTDRSMMSAAVTVKRRRPSMPVAIVVSALEPELILEALRSGVTEVLTEPFGAAQVRAALVRIMASRAPASDGRVVAVIGAKGGVGATTIAVNLAEAFARQVDNALLIDFETGAGDAAVLLGVEPRFSVAEALENISRLDDAYFKGLTVRTPSGLELLAASSRAVYAPVDPQRIRTLLDFVMRSYRAIVLDVSYRDLMLLDALESASAILVVVNQELTSVRSAQRVAGRLRQRYGDRVSLVVNRSDKQADISVKDVESAAGIPVLHVFPSDYRSALAAVNKGAPIAQATQTRLGQSFHECARKLLGEQVDGAEGDGSRLFGWLGPRK